MLSYNMHFLFLVPYLCVLVENYYFFPLLKIDSRALYMLGKLFNY